MRLTQKDSVKTNLVVVALFKIKLICLVEIHQGLRKGHKKQSPAMRGFIYIVLTILQLVVYRYV